MCSSKDKVILGIFLLLAVSIGYSIHITRKFNTIPRESYIDTLKVRIPVPYDSLVLRYETVNLPKVNHPDTIVRNHTDTLIVNDTIFVPVYIPITQNYYKGENYEAWVSGYKPQLDSLNIHAPTTVITIPESSSLLDVNLGLQVGVGWNGDKWSPYIGAGVQIGVPLRKIFKK